MKPQRFRPLSILFSILVPVFSALPFIPPASASLRVHEWGTFTSVQGSDGETLTGLEQEEEALPAFVHNSDPTLDLANAVVAGGGHQPGCKGHNCRDLARLADGSLGITQKMETPVVYFYADQPTKVDLTVDFPHGLISQYYPAPTSFRPELGPNTPLKNGQIHYSGLEILASRSLADPAIPRVDAGNVYAPARATAANLVRIGGETEKFVFYRGLGNFRTSLRVTSDANHLRIRDRFGRGIPYLLAVNVQDGRGSFRELGTLAPNQDRAFALDGFLADLAPNRPQAEFEAGVGTALENALVRSGLYADEARAMVNTWRVSYFRTNGLRILYVLPRAETDAVLPLRISPTPSELVRTLVGRVEVMTTVEERRLAADPSARNRLGRFTAPKLLRVKALTARN